MFIWKVISALVTYVHIWSIWMVQWLGFQKWNYVLRTLFMKSCISRDRFKSEGRMLCLPSEFLLWLNDLVSFLGSGRPVFNFWRPWQYLEGRGSCLGRFYASLNITYSVYYLYLTTKTSKTYIMKVYSPHTKARETFAFTVKVKKPPAQICV